MKNWTWLVVVLWLPVLIGWAPAMQSQGAASVSVESDEAEIRTLLAERDRQIKEVMDGDGEITDAQRDELEKIVNEFVDYPSMAAYALGETWDELSDQTRSSFSSSFAAIVRDQSLNNLEIYRAEIAYGMVDVSDNEAFVETTASLENVTTQVNYRMERRAGNWLITDIILDDVSTADSYRRQFQSVIRQRGFDALFDSVKRRAERIDS